jgi:hypothetical protein
MRAIRIAPDPMDNDSIKVFIRDSTIPQIST